MNKSNYNFFFQNGILVLQDLGGKNAMSLTNNMENVLKDLQRLLSIDLTKRTIIYRDSEQQYDGVKWNGISVDFYPLRTGKLEKALQKVKS